ncbi:MAG: ZPR1 zinc finger domain-containing protein [Candidatus Woesearchaeota archaeon]
MTKNVDENAQAPEVVHNQPCPMCQKKTLTLMEAERDVAFFGKVFVFSMNCSSCHFHKADVETEKGGKPIKVTFDITSEEDMKVRVIKSSTATIKLPRITSIEPGPASNGYVTNIEGIFNRVKNQIESVRDTSDDNDERKKAKNLLKKLRKIMWGEEKLTITLEDPEGNSAIVSEKAVVK